MGYPNRFKGRLIAGLLTVVVGASAFGAATCAAVHSAAGPPSPAASEPGRAGFSSQAMLSAASPTPKKIAEGGLPFVWPADGYVSQGMTPKHPTGIDIAAPFGSEVRAVRDGVVFFVGGDPCCSYGNYIVIGHDSRWSSVYGHLAKFLVAMGDPVKQGQVIALSGQTGHASGPHLHFELRSFGWPVNPLDELWPQRYVERDIPQPVAAAPATPAPQTASLHPDEVTLLAIGWMNQTAPYAYMIDASTCYAMQRAVNWLVTCKGTLQGCAGAPCEKYLSACVLDQPRLITQYCP